MTAQESTALETSIGFDVAVALAHLRGSDAALARLIDAVGPCRLQPKPAASLFFALAEAIVHQQLTAKAAGTIFGRVCALCPGTEGLGPRALLRVTDAELRGAGLSRSKLASLRDLARRVDGGELPSWAEVQDMDDETIIARLSEVRGIGRWTAQMLLIFRLGRPDVLPVDDYGIRKGFARAFRRRELPAPADVEKRGVRWKPYRTVASWYLWRALD
jgi:3-methyladenine DNA glycosylase/8-oxoguanine DNA glycosylase